MASLLRKAKEVVTGKEEVRLGQAGQGEGMQGDGPHCVFLLLGGCRTLCHLQRGLPAALHALLRSL